MLRKVTSEGTLGVGSAALTAAEAMGLKTGGLVRLRRRNDEVTDLVCRYGFKTIDTEMRSEVIRALVQVAPAVIVLAEASAMLASHGEYQAYINAANKARKPLFVADDISTNYYKNRSTPMADWIMDGRYRSVLVLGDREAYNRGVTDKAYRFLRTVFCRVTRVQSTSRKTAEKNYLYAKGVAAKKAD